METGLRAVLDCMRSNGAEAGDTFEISFFFQMIDRTEIQGTDVIAALSLAARRGLVKPIRALVRTYRLTDAGFDAMHEARLSFAVATLDASSAPHIGGLSGN